MLCNKNLTKFDILTLVSSDCRAQALKLSEHLKNDNKCFCFYFANSYFRVIFLHFLFYFKKNYFVSLIFTKFMWWIPFFKMSMTFIKVVKNQTFKKVYLPLKPPWRSCFFHFQSRSRTSVFRQYSFCNSFRHCLIY